MCTEAGDNGHQHCGASFAQSGQDQVFKCLSLRSRKPSPWGTKNTVFTAERSCLNAEHQTPVTQTSLSINPLHEPLRLLDCQRGTKQLGSPRWYNRGKDGSQAFLSVSKGIIETRCT